MDKIENPKQYDLEDRTLEFGKKVRIFVKSLPKTIGALEDGKQVVRSSGSVGANYIEANESLSKKDFLHRIRISRKESKESRYWLEMLEVETVNNPILEKERKMLLLESNELLKILSSILFKSQQS
jgi:four helix bundle protein